MRDPLIDEVREARRRIWEKCGCDMQRYFQHLLQYQEEMRKSGKYRFVDDPSVLKRAPVAEPKAKG